MPFCFQSSPFLSTDWVREKIKRNPDKTMDSYEATSLLFSKIKSLDTENASKIMGYLLIQDLEERDLMRLASSPDSVILSVVLKAKSHLGLSSSNSSAPPSPSPLNPIARPSNANPFSQSSHRIPNNGFDFNKNPCSPSSTNCWSLHGFRNNLISPKSSPLLSYDNIQAGSLQMQPLLAGKNGGSDAGVCTELVDEHQLNQYRSLLSNNGDVHFHRRSYSASDVCFDSEDGGFKPCLYFARGFCKNGSNCKFMHGGFADSVDTSGEAFPDQREEIIRLKAAQQQRFGASSQFMAGVSPSHYKYMNFLLQQQNEPQRASAGALMMGEEFHKFGLYRNERNDLFSMAAAEKRNSASRQIYLTFPADSTFKDEDVSEYFSKFGPVQDVRIPYQQKRMFGFVTFVFPETVKLILVKGNPHFICDSRVLVKPYKEKGKIAEKRLPNQQQSQELGEFSPSLSPSGIDCRDPFDLNLGRKTLYDSHDMLLRRRLEEQAELQRVIELQGRRLMNLQLPDLNNRVKPHHNSLSSGDSLPSESHSHIHQSITLPLDRNYQQLTEGLGDTQTPLHLEMNPFAMQRNICSRSEECSKCELLDINSNVEEVLPDSLSSSPKKPDLDQHCHNSRTIGLSWTLQTNTLPSQHNASESKMLPL